MTLSHPFLRIFGVLYVGLGTNVLLAAASLPLSVVLWLMGPAEALGLLLFAAVLAAPGLTAAFEVFRRYSDGGSVDVVRGFLTAYRRFWGRSVIVGGVAALAFLILGVDVMVVSGTRWGAALIPLFVAMILLVTVLVLTCLVGIVENPDVGLIRLVRAGPYLLLRRLPLLLLSLVGMCALVTITATNPVLGLGVVTAPLLYIVWANTRHALAPLTEKV